MLASHELINSYEVDDVTLVERWGGGRYQCYLTALNLSLAKRPTRIGRNVTSCRSTSNMNCLTIFALAASVVAALGIPLTDTTLARDEMMGPDMMVGPELMIYPFKIEFKGKSYTPNNGNAFCQIPKTKYYNNGRLIYNNGRNGSYLTLEEKRRWLILNASPRGQCST